MNEVEGDVDKVGGGVVIADETGATNIFDCSIGSTSDTVEDK